MRTPKIATLLLAMTAVLGLACGDDGTTPGAEDSGQTPTTGVSGDGSGTVGMTSMNPGDDDDDDDDVDPTGGGDDDDDDDDDDNGCPNEPQPMGASCTEDCECESNECYFISVLGGVCGECNEDADCEGGGCTIPNPLTDPPTGAVCNTGSNGEGCETDEVCQDGLSCGTLLEVPGIISLDTCGQCLVDGDCMEGQFCSPTINIADFNGELLCVDPGTVPNGQACDHLGTGDMACESGVCAMVDIMMIAQVGVCGDCEVDADCMDGMVCSSADIDLDLLEVIPPTCVAPR